MKKTALVVDDSPTMRSMIKAALDQIDFESITAQDGEKALKIIGDKEVDLIVTDILMPNMDGIELIKNLRERSASKFVPILVISTEGSTDIKNSGKEAGATGWIIKPFQPEVLHSAVKKICGI